MSKSEKKAKVKRQKAKVRMDSRIYKKLASSYFFLLPFAFLLLFSGCRQDMQNQPRYIAYRESNFFRDGMSSRPLVEGTVPRGYLRDDSLLYTGKVSVANQQGASQNRQAAENAAPQTGTTQSNPTMAAATGAGAQPNGVGSEADSTVFPFPVTQQVLERGRERYQIFCAVCHGLTGDGDGMVVRRGFRKPTSYYDPPLRSAAVGHFFDVMTNGWGAMPSYAQQIPATDRWAIIESIRALQATRPQTATDTQGAASLPQQQPAQTGGQR